MPGKASGQLKIPEKRIASSKQAPFTGGLSRLITIPPRLAEVMIGNHPECKHFLFGNKAGNLAMLSRGDVW
jgi:hypothetical protein